MTQAAIHSCCETLVWVLMHSLWQGALIAVAVWSALRWLPARRAERRYGIAAFGLAAVVMGLLVTWSVLRLEPAAQGHVVALSELRPSRPEGTGTSLESVGENVGNRSRAEDGKPSKQAVVGAQSLSRDWTNWLAALWLVGAGVMLARALLGLVQAQGFARADGGLAGLELSALEGLARELCERLGLKRAVRLVVSDRIRTPAVLGVLWPCVLIPVAMLSGVPVEQWRIVLAHELAHIRRHDALVNLVQMLIESLLFFNPAVWWLSRQIRVEREACCDVLAADMCGPPLSVARALVEVAASLQELPQRSIPSASLLAFVEPDHEGELTDRVQRLVDPDRASRPKVSWLGLGAVLLALLLAGIVLQRGTDLAVRTAAEWMSPKERVDRLARLHAEASGVFLPAATSSAKEDADATEGKGTLATTESIDKTLTVTVVVRTEDGSPIPGLQLNSQSRTGNSSMSQTLDHTRDDLPEYRRTFHFAPCRLRIGAYSKGFAVAVSPIISLFEDDSERTIELVLKRGSTATFKILDEQQRPIPNAELKTTARVSIDGGSSGCDTRFSKSDEQGMVAITNIGEIEYDQELRAPGFQRADRISSLTVAAPTEWQLKQARPTNIKVVDAVSGEPVAKARFDVAHWQRANHGYGFGNPRSSKSSSWQTFAESDSEGRAALTELQDGTSYTFGVVAEGYGMAVLDDVKGGQPDRVIQLSPPLKLAGVVGPLSRLHTTGDKEKGTLQRYIGYTTRLSNAIHDSGRVTVDLDGRFEIAGLVTGEQVTVGIPDQWHMFVMKDSLLDVNVNLDKPTAVEKAFPNREVVLRLTGTSPDALARGTLYVDWQHSDPQVRRSQNGPLPIRDNEIRMSIPVGARLGFHPQNLAGYLIDEQDQLEIAAGDAPLIINVPTRPAGGIHGTVVRADGRPATSTFVTIFATKLPPGEKDHHRINPSSASASSSFLVTLPLGGRYRVLAREMVESHNVWTLSEEITLDESQPISELKLTLPTGRTLPIKIVDSDGKPVVDQPVTLKLSFSQKDGHSFGTDLVQQTGVDGVARFEMMSCDTSIKPLDFKLYAEVTPVRFMGRQELIDPSRPVEIRLQRGLSATGVLINAESGKPLPNVEVRVFPRDLEHANFKGNIRVKTNSRGEFRFEGLENLEYTGHVDGSVPKGTVITPYGNGGARYSYPNGVEQHSLRAGSSDPVRWEVLIPPGSSLKAGE